MLWTFLTKDKQKITLETDDNSFFLEQGDCVTLNNLLPVSELDENKYLFKTLTWNGETSIENIDSIFNFLLSKIKQGYEPNLNISKIWKMSEKANKGLGFVLKGARPTGRIGRALLYSNNTGWELAKINEVPLRELTLLFDEAYKDKDELCEFRFCFEFEIEIWWVTKDKRRFNETFSFYVYPEINLGKKKKAKFYSNNLIYGSEYSRLISYSEPYDWYKSEFILKKLWNT